MTSIAVCMIVKNEEEVLGRCLSSIVGLWDELIIVDTGSTDRTIEIAESYGARVLHYNWVAPGNKSEARNLGIVQAVSQWIVIIDADEVLLNAEQARRFILGSQADAIMPQFNNYINGQITLSWLQVRAFQRSRYFYKYREHEVPVSVNEQLHVQSAPEIIIEHRAPDGRQTGKNAPMMARLALDVEENPNDPHPLYFYHRECVNQGDNQRAIELGQRYLELTRNGTYIQAEVYANMAVAYQNLGNGKEATKHMAAAAACEPHKREWLYKLAVLYTQQNLWNPALAILRAAAELMPTEDRQWEPQLTARIYDLMGICQRNFAHDLAHGHTH